MTVLVTDDDVTKVVTDSKSRTNDDVRVYREALSQGEILWPAGNTSPVAKPFQGWDDASTAIDRDGKPELVPGLTASLAHDNPGPAS